MNKKENCSRRPMKKYKNYKVKMELHGNENVYKGSKYLPTNYLLFTKGKQQLLTLEKVGGHDLKQVLSVNTINTGI